MSGSNLHKNAHQSDDNMHEIKAFPLASKGHFNVKNIKGLSEWQRNFRQPNILGQLNGYDAPTTEVDGDVYLIQALELDVDGIVWQSASTVRFTFTSGYSDIYAVGNFLQVSGAANSKHNGVFVIVTTNASYLEVTIVTVTDGTDDVASGSVALAYVSHEDYDPESLSNDQSIPRVGFVRYFSDTDLWYGNSIQEGDETLDTSINELVNFINGSVTTSAIIKTVVISLNATEIKALNTTPIDVIAAPGSGKAIEIVSASAAYTFGIAAFVSNTLSLLPDTSTTEQMITGFLQNATNSKIKKFMETVGNTGNGFQLIEDKKMTVIANADSAFGAGSIKLHIAYRIITI